MTSRPDFLPVCARLALPLMLCLSACQSKSSAEPRFNQQPAAATKPTPATPPSTPVESSAPAAAPAPSLMEAPARAVLVRQPTSPDPLDGKFTLAQATEGLPKKGPLHATIDTGLGKLECKLYDDKAPNTVANFIGLARGLRPWWDAKQAAWVKRPLFDLTSFHRVIPDFMIQGGDFLGDGSGEVGYVIPDEVKAGLKHDRAGLLCMANRGPDTNGGQFFITDAATPHLTQMGTYTIFGECAPTDLVAKIARVPKGDPRGDRPLRPVEITHVAITRK